MYSFKKQPIKTLAPGKRKFLPFCSVAILQKNENTEVSFATINYHDCKEKKALLHLFEIIDYKLDYQGKKAQKIESVNTVPSNMCFQI